MLILGKRALVSVNSGPWVGAVAIYSGNRICRYGLAEIYGLAKEYRRPGNSLLTQLLIGSDLLQDGE